MTTKIQTFGGNIGIGTNDPGNFKLNVNGSLKTSSLVVNGVQNAQVPIGLIQLWYGSSGSIPSGWALCNGGTYTRTDGGGNITTPDLRTKFIRGADGDAPSPVATGTSGGQNNVTLAVANLASHSHGVSVSTSNAPHGHGVTGTTNAAHNHGMPDNETPHSHNTTESNGNHNHALSEQNAPHSHNAYGQGGVAHNHNAGQANIGSHSHQRPQIGLINGPLGFSAFRKLYVQSYRNNSLISGTADVPHSHTMDNTPGQNHAHSSNASSWGHTHTVGANNTQHSHTTTGNNQMPHSHTLGQGGNQHAHGYPQSNAPHNHPGSSNSAGEGTSFPVLNAYYALFYIMKI